MSTIEVRGVPMRVFDSAPPNMRVLWEMTAAHGDKTYIVYEDERYSFNEIHAQVRKLAAHLAEPSLYTFDGKEYKVHPWTFEVQAQFERHLERCAVEAYQRAAPLLSPDDAAGVVVAQFLDGASAPRRGGRR
jgi:hypothetical protein